MRQRIRRYLYFVGASLVIASAIYFTYRHLEYVKMHTIPAGLQAFDVNGPVSN